MDGEVDVRKHKNTCEGGEQGKGVSVQRENEKNLQGK